MDWSLLRSWVRGSKRSLTIDGHLSKCWVFLTLQCLYRELEWLRGWPDAYFLRLYKKKSPEALHSGCLLEAPRVAVMATVDQGSCTLIVLGRGALRQTARLYQFRQCKKARKPNIWETECWKYFPWVKIIPALAGHLQGIPSQRATLCQQRERRKVLPYLHWDGDRQDPGCRTLCLGSTLDNDWSQFWTRHMCACSPIDMSSHCPQSTRVQGPHGPALSSGACQGFCGNSRGWEGDADPPLPWVSFYLMSKLFPSLM